VQDLGHVARHKRISMLRSTREQSRRAMGRFVTQNARAWAWLAAPSVSHRLTLKKGASICRALTIYVELLCSIIRLQSYTRLSPAHRSKFMTPLTALALASPFPVPEREHTELLPRHPRPSPVCCLPAVPTAAYAARVRPATLLIA
jgi:hypothetical protein